MKLALATFGFSLGSALAAALFSAHPGHLNRAAARPVVESSLPPGRIAIPPPRPRISRRSSDQDGPQCARTDVLRRVSLGRQRRACGPGLVRVDLERSSYRCSARAMRSAPRSSSTAPTVCRTPDRQVPDPGQAQGSSLEHVRCADALYASADSRRGFHPRQRRALGICDAWLRRRSHCVRRKAVRRIARRR